MWYFVMKYVKCGIVKVITTCTSCFVQALENCNSGKLHILKFRCVMVLMMHCKKCRFQIKLISEAHFGEITLVCVNGVGFQSCL